MPEHIVHCWEDYISTLEWGSTEWAEAFREEKNATCMLLQGHEGPHEWTPDSDIRVSFAEDADA